MTMTWLDTHMHLDFLPEGAPRRRLVEELARRGIAVVAQTLRPSEHRVLADEVATWDGPKPLIAVGFHPWLLADPVSIDDELAQVRTSLAHTRFVGEIGLDFTPHRLEVVPAVRQCEVFEAMLEAACAAAGGQRGPTVLSIHAVRATTAVLNLLEAHDVAGHHVVPVVHRFSGTSDELTRLLRAGGHVSASPHHMRSKRGRAYLGRIPLSRLLLETDLPGARGEDVDADHLASTLQGIIAALVDLRGARVIEAILASQARLFGPL